MREQGYEKILNLEDHIMLEPHGMDTKPEINLNFYSGKEVGDDIQSKETNIFYSTTL